MSGWGEWGSASQMLEENPYVIDIPDIRDPSGSIGIVEPRKLGLPFDLKRVYYLFDLEKGTVRGRHAHKELIQVLIAVRGTFHIELDNGLGKKIDVKLHTPSQGLVVPAGWWRIIDVLNDESILLALVSEEFKENDYFRDYNVFVEWRRKMM